jgi:uncharacterized protein Usg
MIIIHRKEFVIVCVVYYRPDYRHILQDFIWETQDIVPDLPRVHEFLNYWKINIEAPIKEVIVSSSKNKDHINSNFYRVLQ